MAELHKNIVNAKNSTCEQFILSFWHNSKISGLNDFCLFAHNDNIKIPKIIYISQFPWNEEILTGFSSQKISADK